MDINRRALLGTARLSLRPLRQEDAPHVIAGIGQLRVSRYLSVVPHPYGPEDFAHYLGIARPGFHWAIEDADGHVGGISLDPGLGFWIAPDRQGRGYVTEAARAVLAAHFADPEAGPVSSGYFTDNAASAAVHRRLGFVTTSVEDKLCRALGVSRPLLRQLLTREDWAGQGATAPYGLHSRHGVTE
ncbi:MAG TPA: GNAT family N-acetyltransferase [Tabrizicola sp.]|nr:GNAT family N-acetyltransferase [Tabrizicola sp.]